MKAIKKYVGFYLQRRRKWGDDMNYERPVVMVFNYHGKSLCSLTGLKVALCNWDSKRQRVKAAVKRSGEVNKYLDGIEEKINDIYYTGLSAGDTISNTYILDRLKDRPKEAATKSFWHYYDEFMATQRTVIKHSTYKCAMTSYNRFKEFCDDYHPNIKFEEITPKLLADYNNYLLKCKNTNNTIHTHLKRLRRFLGYAKRLHLHQNDSYKEYNVQQRVGEIKFLDMNEVKLLMDVELTSIMEQKARDLFLFGTFTGMRYSDIKNLKKADIIQHRFEGIDGVFHAAHIRQVKTAAPIVVPLLDESMAIIKKYEDLPKEFALPQLALQVVNEVLKNVGRKAKLNAMQKIDTFRGVERETKYIEKWKVLSTHAARRSFVTIAATKGLPINVVSSITGQHPTTIMKHYLSVTSADKFQALMAKMNFTDGAKVKEGS